MVENWDSNFEKTKGLIDIQEHVSYAQIDANQKDNIIHLIDALIIGEARAMNDVEVALSVLRNLIPDDNKYDDIRKIIDEIESNPADRENNRTLGKQILESIQNDTTIDDKYKVIIKQQLLTIINSGYVAPESNSLDTQKTSNGFAETALSILKIIGIILLIIITLGVIAFVIYRRGRENENIGFQDYIIDNVFHGKKSEENSTIAPNLPVETPKVEPTIDPLKNFTPPEEKIPDPLANTETVSEEVKSDGEMPSWLKPQADTVANSLEKNSANFSETSEGNSGEHSGENLNTESGGLPDWLKPQTENSPTSEVTTEEKNSENFSEISEGNSTVSAESFPNWLNSNSTSEKNIPANSLPLNTDTPASEITESDTKENNFSYTHSKKEKEVVMSVENTENTLPNWLVNSAQENTENTLPNWLVNSDQETTDVSMKTLIDTTNPETSEQSEETKIQKNPKNHGEKNLCRQGQTF